MTKIPREMLRATEKVSFETGRGDWGLRKSSAARWGAGGVASRSQQAGLFTGKLLEDNSSHSLTSVPTWACSGRWVFCAGCQVVAGPHRGCIAAVGDGLGHLGALELPVWQRQV